jgi:hypothetical protein
MVFLLPPGALSAAEVFNQYGGNQYNFKRREEKTALTAGIFFK